MMQFLQSYGPLLAVVAAIIVASLIAKFSIKQNEESLGQFGVGFTNGPVNGERFEMVSLPPEPQKKEESRKGLIGSLLAAAAAPVVKPKRRQKKSTVYDNRRSGKEELQARRKRQRQARRRARALVH